MLRRYRHRGIGIPLAKKVWLHCPGRWQIRVMEKNVLARKFWESSIVKFTGQPAQSTNFVKEGAAWHRFSLDSRRYYLAGDCKAEPSLWMDWSLAEGNQAFAILPA